MWKYKPDAIEMAHKPKIHRIIDVNMLSEATPPKETGNSYHARALPRFRNAKTKI